jgi:hypothetical protein
MELTQIEYLENLLYWMRHQKQDGAMRSWIEALNDVILDRKHPQGLKAINEKDLALFMTEKSFTGDLRYRTEFGQAWAKEICSEFAQPSADELVEALRRLLRWAKSWERYDESIEQAEQLLAKHGRGA